MKISQIKKSDVSKLSLLHIQSLPNTVSSKIGAFYLERIYKVVAQNTKTHFGLKAIENGKIVGAVCSTTNLKRFEEDVKKQLSLKDYLKILLAIISFRITIIDLIRRISFEKSLAGSYNKNYCSIVIFFVNQDFRRKGIGLLLIKEILSFYKGKVDNIYVDTLLSNKTAIKFYRAFGFKEVKNIENSVLLVSKK